MRFKLIASIIGVVIALSVVGVATIWAQGGTTTTATHPCDQYQQALAQRLGVSVDKLTQAQKDAAKDMIDQAVKDNKLTADQAAAAKQRIDQAQGGCGVGVFGFGHGGRFGGFVVPPAGVPHPTLPFTGTRPTRPFTSTRPTLPFTGTRPFLRTFEGATVTQVVADSPAAKAGLQVNDVIIAVGGQKVDNQHLLNTLIGQKKPGDTVELQIQRGSETKTINVTLGANPNNASTPYLGIQFAYGPRPGRR